MVVEVGVWVIAGLVGLVLLCAVLRWSVGAWGEVSRPQRVHHRELGATSSFRHSFRRIVHVSSDDDAVIGDEEVAGELGEVFTAPEVAMSASPVAPTYASAPHPSSHSPPPRRILTRHAAQPTPTPPPAAAIHCPICLEDIARSQRSSSLPCGHLFHTACIREWSLHSSTCPLDRTLFSFHATHRGNSARSVVIVVG
jgi:Ring finger domain